MMHLIALSFSYHTYHTAPKIICSWCT